MSGLRPGCQGGECCLCEENECSVSLSARGDTILFVDGEEAITGGERCDCIIVMRRESRIEVYSIELKNIQSPHVKSEARALDPDRLRRKCGNCLDWAQRIIGNFNSTRSNRFQGVDRYRILVIPGQVFSMINTLLRRERRRFLPGNASGGRVLPCGMDVTSQGYPLDSQRR